MADQRITPRDSIRQSRALATALAKTRTDAMAALDVAAAGMAGLALNDALTRWQEHVTTVLHQQQAAGRVAAWHQALAATRADIAPASLPISDTRSGTTRTGTQFTDFLQRRVSGITSGLATMFGTPAEAVADLQTSARQITGSIAFDEYRASVADIANSSRDVGWAREADGNACGFCQMLASRGPVYSERSVDFEAHAHCQCRAYAVSRDAFTVTAEQAAGRDAFLARARKAITTLTPSPTSTALPGMITPGRLTALRAQVASYEPIVASGNATEWMQATLPGLRTELATLEAVLSSEAS